MEKSNYTLADYLFIHRAIIRVLHALEDLTDETKIKVLEECIKSIKG